MEYNDVSIHCCYFPIPDRCSNSTSYCYTPLFSETYYHTSYKITNTSSRKSAPSTTTETLIFWFFSTSCKNRAGISEPPVLCLSPRLASVSDDLQKIVNPEFWSSSALIIQFAMPLKENFDSVNDAWNCDGLWLDAEIVLKLLLPWPSLQRTWSAGCGMRKLFCSSDSGLYFSWGGNRSLCRFFKMQHDPFRFSRPKIKCCKRKIHCSLSEWLNLLMG